MIGIGGIPIGGLCWGYFTEDDEHDMGEVDNGSNIDEVEEYVDAQLVKQAQMDATDYRTQFQCDCIEFLSSQ